MHIRVLLQFGFAVVSFVSMLWVSQVRAESGAVQVTLVLICDVYEMSERGGRGGFARLATAIQAERERSSNVIVVHAGDTISPSLFSGFDQGAHIITLTNLIAPDVFVPGNHEFDFGEVIYRKRMSEANFPVLAANLRDNNGERLPGHEDIKHFTFEGIKVSVIGLTADDSPKKSSPGTLQFKDSVPLAKSMARTLREEGADIVVAVAHANRKQDLRLFYSHAADILLSGDDHDLALLYDGQSAMAESMADGEFITAIDLRVTVDESQDGKRTVHWRPRFRIIDTADIEPDQTVAAVVAKYEVSLADELDVPLGDAAAGLDSRKAVVRMGEAAIGNLIADAMRERMSADVAIMNGGGIRGNKVYQAETNLTRRDILTELPFGNKVYLVEMTGSQLIKALENGLWFAGKPNGRFAQISGLKLTASLDSYPGERLQSVQVDSAPLEPSKKYTVATNDFIAAGNEGYDVFKEAEILVGETDGPLVANVVMDYIQAKGTVAPKIEGRIVLH